MICYLITNKYIQAVLEVWNLCQENPFSPGVKEKKINDHRKYYLINLLIKHKIILADWRLSYRCGRRPEVLWYSSVSFLGHSSPECSFTLFGVAQGYNLNIGVVLETLSRHRYKVLHLPCWPIKKKNAPLKGLRNSQLFLALEIKTLA